MNCKSVQKQLNAWVDGQLSSADTGRVWGHLNKCERCSAEAKTLLTIKEDLTQYFKETKRVVPSKRMKHALMSKAKASINQQSVHSIIVEEWITLAAAAAFGLIMGIGLYGFTPERLFQIHRPKLIHTYAVQYEQSANMLAHIPYNLNVICPLTGSR